MTRDQAIELRQKQLQGQAVSPELVEEAIAVLLATEPKRVPKPAMLPYAMRTYGLSSVIARRNDNKQVKLLMAVLEGKA